MELSPFGRIAAFAAVVLVLTGMAVWLFLPESSSAGGSARRPQSHRSSSPGPVPTPRPTAPGLADIYQWLPFSPAGLTSAAQVTVEFAKDYGTFSYTESSGAYVAPMRRLATSQLLQVIGRAYAAPGLAAARASGRQVSVATASIESLRAFGPSSLTFIVDITQRIAGPAGSKQQSTGYAVTVTGTGTSWQVSDIELEGAGNQ